MSCRRHEIGVRRAIGATRKDIQSQFVVESFAISLIGGIAGIIIGIVAKPELPDMLRWSFFYLFLFSIGYSVGPQFFGSLKKEALPQIAIAVVVAVSGLAAVVAVTAVFGFDEGLAVGILSGAMTQSAALGTAIIVAAPCAHGCVRGPVQKAARAWPLNSVVRQHVDAVE